MAVLVQMFVYDDQAPRTAKEGVTVSVYRLDDTLVTAGVTDVNGRVEFSLPGSDPDVSLGREYACRFYRSGISIDSPQSIYVEEPVVDPNIFEVVCHDMAVFPPSPDPDFCRLMGQMIDGSGRPVSGYSVRFSLTRSPVALSRSRVLVREVFAQGDDSGFLVVDLVRGGIYEAILPGFENMVFTIHVPEASGWDLTKCLFPYPATLAFDPSEELDIEVGEEALLTPILTLSDGRVLTDLDALAWVTPTAGEDITVDLAVDAQWKVTGLKVGADEVSGTVKEGTVETMRPQPEMVVTPVIVMVT